MRTTVLMAGVGEIGDVLLKSPDPGLVELRKALPPGVLERYVQVVGEVDAIRFVRKATPVSLLMQFGEFNQYFDRERATRYATAAALRRRCSGTTPPTN